jgi:hypothetical protein
MRSQSLDPENTLVSCPYTANPDKAPPLFTAKCGIIIRVVVKRSTVTV